MKQLIIGYALFAGYLIVTSVQSGNNITLAITIAALLMFALTYASAQCLLGAKATLRFALIALSLGWFAEQMGSTHGWFFGSYVYTEVLGARLVGVPLIIPLMWFALCYVAYVLTNLIIWHRPVDDSPDLKRAAAMAFIAAMIVTAYDLGADPYLVFTLKAWIMTKTDGWWFGETVQGFFGWVFVAFVIGVTFRLWMRELPAPAVTSATKRAALVPFAIYGGSMLFQIFFGLPVETRSIAAFAMGIPLICAFAGWLQWKAGAAAGGRG
jgi:uncharacterized membrane protein